MKVYNIKDKNKPADAVYVGRPSKFGNPFVVGKHGNREQVVTKYKNWLLSKPELCELAKSELKGKDLVCFCAPLPCHGDVLLELANK